MQNLARIVGSAGVFTTGASGAILGVGPQIGVAAVATYAHQPWLERMLEGIASAVQR